jgi:succinate-semialdehyde dehydrogenase/glutarate-semialdehyde dehydrogenase
MVKNAARGCLSQQPPASPHPVTRQFSRPDTAASGKSPEALKYGIVGINRDHLETDHPVRRHKAKPHRPRGSRYGIEEFRDVKYLCIGGIDP